MEQVSEREKTSLLIYPRLSPEREMAPRPGAFQTKGLSWFVCFRRFLFPEQLPFVGDDKHCEVELVGATKHHEYQHHIIGKLKSPPLIIDRMSRPQMAPAVFCGVAD